MDQKDDVIENKEAADTNEQPQDPQNVYEYHISSLKLDKVDGNFQIGHLLHNHVSNQKGIHKIFVDEIRIYEIGASGTVGLGVIEKEPGEEVEKIAPELASGEVRRIYNEIKRFLRMDKVPVFFQHLAKKEKVLEEVWEIFNQEKKLKEWVAGFEGGLRSVLEKNKPSFSFVDEIDPSSLKLLEGAMEEETKALGLVIFLLELLLPGYMEKVLKKDEKWGEYKEGKVKEEEIFREIKKRYRLINLPDVFDQLRDDPTVLVLGFFNTLKPMAAGDKDKIQVGAMKQFLVKSAGDMEFGSKEAPNLSDSNLAFLLSVLSNQLRSLPKTIFIEYQMMKTFK